MFILKSFYCKPEPQWLEVQTAIHLIFGSRRYNCMFDSPISGSGLYFIQFPVDLISFPDWPPLFKQMVQSPVEPANGHTHGCLMQRSKATWLIQAHTPLLRLYWIDEKSAKRNASVLWTPSRLHARTFRQQNQGPSQWKALYMDMKKLGTVR